MAVQPVVLSSRQGQRGTWTPRRTQAVARQLHGLDRALLAGGADAWLSGLRRADDPGRSDTPVVDVDQRGLLKLNPLADWSNDYAASHGLEVNALVAQGYPSIGCWPCTEPAPDDDLRSGRWAGSTKTECGLHR